MQRRARPVTRDCAAIYARPRQSASARSSRRLDRAAKLEADRDALQRALERGQTACSTCCGGAQSWRAWSQSELALLSASMRPRRSGELIEFTNPAAERCGPHFAR